MLIPLRPSPPIVRLTNPGDVIFEIGGIQPRRLVWNATDWITNFNNIRDDIDREIIENLTRNQETRGEPVLEANSNRMNYDQLRRGYPDLTDRYFPDLSNVSNAVNALQLFDTDPRGTPAEREALQNYIATNTVRGESPYRYRWCNECESMVGFEAHVHCPRCTYPAILERVEGLVHGHNPVINACRNCGDCCRVLGCRNCTQCNTHCAKDKICKHCGKCNRLQGNQHCCTCRICTACLELGECPDCNNCFDHCTCPPLRTNGIHGKTFPAFKPSERKLFKCSRLAGVEWEYNTTNTNKYINYWIKKWIGERHEDASCGWEAVTPPAAGDYLVKCINSLGLALEKSHAVIDHRCSIHVHADAKDLMWSDMFRLLKLYAKLEPVLYILAGQERLGNRYCLPIGKEYAQALERIDKKDAVMTVAFGQTNATIPGIGHISQRAKPGKRADVHRHCRRRGLNICPWLAGRLRKVGKQKSIAPDTTVEFRIHPNSSDKEQVLNWAKVVVLLVDWVAKHSDKELEAIMSKTPLHILCEDVAPECKAWMIKRMKDWRKQNPQSAGTRRVKFNNGKYTY